MSPLAVLLFSLQASYILDFTLSQVEVQYEVIGDSFKASEGTFRVKIVLGNEESYGGGNNALEAKQAAALQVQALNISLLDRYASMVFFFVFFIHSVYITGSNEYKVSI